MMPSHSAWMDAAGEAPAALVAVVGPLKPTLHPLAAWAGRRRLAWFYEEARGQKLYPASSSGR